METLAKTLGETCSLFNTRWIDKGESTRAQGARDNGNPCMSERSVTVIGAGVIGLTCAHYLLRTGWKVTVMDRGDHALGAASHANCGLLALSHVLPLAEPGVIGKTVKSLFQPNSPFRVKPRLDLALWVWFHRQGSKVWAAECSRGMIASDAYVVATGAWTSRLSKNLGGRIPIQPGTGYSMTMPRPRNCPVIPLIFQDEKVAVTPMRSGFRLGSTMEFRGYDRSINKRRLDVLKRAAELYLHEPHCEPVEEEWFGWRPMTYDTKPIIDFCPDLNNVVVAAGHGMLGLSMAPATGKLVSELLNKKQPHINPKPYAFNRFE